MDKITFIPVTDEAGIAAVEALAGEIWREYYTPIIGAAQVEYMLARFQSRAAIGEQIKEGYLYFLAKDESGREAGYLAAVPRGDELFLSKIYVTKENRRKGYGRQMVNLAENIAKGKNLGRMTLTVNKSNFNSLIAYLKMGFTITGPVTAHIGGGFVMDDYALEKKVS